MNLIDGKKIANDIKAEIVQKVLKIQKEDGKIPHLAAIIVGEDGASQTYVASKEKSCKEVGFDSSVYRFPESISEEELLNTVEFINNDDDIDGLIVQLPLPKHIDADLILKTIKPSKDVDGFHPENVGKMVVGWDTFLPATPYGIVELLTRSKIETEGKHCVVIGRSNIVGTPISIMMSRNVKTANCTVTICHSKTKNIKEITKQADILIVAIGKPEFLTADMVKEGAVIIDVGVHRIEDAKKQSGYRLVGDVNFNDVAEKCSYITPVPGGVGPMTIVSLLQNTLKAAQLK